MKSYDPENDGGAGSEKSYDPEALGFMSEKSFDPEMIGAASRMM
jgi:hypothetical protein